MSYDIGELSPLKRHWLLRGSNIPRRFLGTEPADILQDSGEFPQIIETWLENTLDGQIIRQIGGLGMTGVGLLFDGKPGLGKTTHAVTTIMEFIRRLPDDTDKARKILDVSPDNYGHSFRPVYYMTYPEFLSRKKALIDTDADGRKELLREMEGFHGRAKEDWLNVRLLVLDDLGKEYGSKYENTSFDEILRARYDRGLPTIITTNRSLEGWATQYGDAMGSFAYEAFYRVPLNGKDLRR